MSIISFTGHRPDKLVGIEDAIKSCIFNFLLQEKPEKIISGLAPGVDTIALLTAHELKIQVIGAMPWLGHVNSSSWNYGKNKDLYLSLLDKCSSVHVVSDDKDYKPWYYQKRNEWMVDNSDMLAAVWNGTSGGTKNCIQYANRRKKQIKYIYTFEKEK